MRDDAEGDILQEAARKCCCAVVVSLAAVLPASHVTSQQPQPVPTAQVYPRLRTTQATCLEYFLAHFSAPVLERTTFIKVFLRKAFCSTLYKWETFHLQVCDLTLLDEQVAHLLVHLHHPCRRRRIRTRTGDIQSSFNFGQAVCCFTDFLLRD